MHYPNLLSTVSSIEMENVGTYLEYTYIPVPEHLLFTIHVYQSDWCVLSTLYYVDDWQTVRV